MNKIHKLFEFKKYPIHLLFHIGYNWDDIKYLKWMYLLRMHKRLDIINPQTYSEKLQWLKLHFFNSTHSIFVDKNEVKKYIAEKIGEEYVVRSYGVWDSFEDIDFDVLPEKFVLKCTHDSGSYYIVKDKSKMNYDEARRKINKGLRRCYFKRYRETPYKYLKPRVIAEEFLPTTDGEVLTDYKFFCFGGEPKIMYISKDTSSTARTDFFDMEFNHLDLRMKDPNSEVPPLKPEKFEEMKELAKVLCAGFPHVRVDFYVVNDQIYFGEFTFFHNGGFTHIQPADWDYRMGSWIELPSIKQ